MTIDMAQNGISPSHHHGMVSLTYQMQSISNASLDVSNEYVEEVVALVVLVSPAAMDVVLLDELEVEVPL